MRQGVWFQIIFGLVALFMLITPGQSFNPLIIFVLLPAVFLNSGYEILNIYEQLYPEIVVDMFRQGLFPTFIIFLFLLALTILSVWLCLRRIDEHQTAPGGALIGGIVFGALALTAFTHTAMHAYLLYHWLS